MGLLPGPEPEKGLQGISHRLGGGSLWAQAGLGGVEPAQAEGPRLVLCCRSHPGASCRTTGKRVGLRTPGSRQCPPDPPTPFNPRGSSPAVAGAVS